MFIDLIKTTALLLALCLLHGISLRAWRDREWLRQISSGLIFGGVCIVGMMMPIVLAPGLIFDGRTAILSMASLFGGPVTGILAGIIAAAYRAWLGGAGALTGIATIVLAVALGLGFRQLSLIGVVARRGLSLLAFGTLLHLLVLLLFALLPATHAAQIYGELALPYLLTLAPATALLGLLLQDLEDRSNTERALQQSQNRMRAITRAVPDVLMVLDDEGRYVEILNQDDQLLYASSVELIGKRMHDLLPTPLADRLLDLIIDSLNTGNCLSIDYELDTLSGRCTFEARCQPLPELIEARRAVVLLARDITERVKLEEERRIAAIAFESQQGMVIAAADTTILRVNKAFSQITGYPPEEVIGQKTSMLSSGRHGPDFYQKMWHAIASHGIWEGEIWNRRRNGEIFPERLSVSAVRNDHDEVSHYVASFMDITVDKAAEEEIRTLAFYDHLTGLPNRRLFADRLAQASAHSARSAQQGALMFIDLDDFKNINDLFGHHCGDLLLQQAAARLRQALRETDTVARLGGDEFVILLENLEVDPIEAAANAELVGENVLQALSRPFTLENNTHTITASIGIVMFNDHDHSVEELMQRADLSMYESKRVGKNTLRFFDPLMQESVAQRLSLEQEIREAIRTHQFVLHYQPQFNLDTGLFGVEALVRWQHPSRGLLAPAAFLPVAEAAGLMPALGQRVLELATHQLAQWHSAPAAPHRGRGLTLSVNIGAEQLYQPDFADDVLALLDATGAPADQLMLELTESSLLSDVEIAVATMRRLRSAGIRFSIDDFGTGYSSLAYLQRLPLNELKIDRSFVSELPDNGNSLAIARTIVALASSLELVVIAEGVETIAQRDSLSANGCTNFQGYLFSRPLPAAEIDLLLMQTVPFADR